MSPDQSSQAGAAIAGLAGTFAIVGLIGLAIGIAVWWIIYTKAGYNGARSLLMLIPIVNLIMIILFIFSEWPVQQEVKALRQQLAMRGGQYPPAPGQPPYPPQQQQPPYPSNPQYPQYR